MHKKIAIHARLKHKWRDRYKLPYRPSVSPFLLPKGINTCGEGKERDITSFVSLTRPPRKYVRAMQPILQSARNIFKKRFSPFASNLQNLTSKQA